MSVMRERLNKLSPELWQSLENSWRIAMTNWLPKVEMGNSSDSSNSYPHLHNLENQLDRIILSHEGYHVQTVSNKSLDLSASEIYVICASILFHDMGRIYQNKDQKKIDQNGMLYLAAFIDNLIKGIIDEPELLKKENPNSIALQKAIEKEIEKHNSKILPEINTCLDKLLSRINELKGPSSKILKKLTKVKNDISASVKLLSSEDLERIMKIPDLLDDKLAKDKEIFKIVKKLKRLWGKLNLISPKNLRKLEDIVLHAVSESLSLSEKKSSTLKIIEKLKIEIKKHFHDLDSFIKANPIAAIPQHGYYTRRILINENHYAELGIPSKMLAKAIANICEFHTNPDLSLPQTMAVNPYGKIRCRELAALLLLIDDMDDSSTRVYSEYIKSKDGAGNDFKAAFRRKTGDVYLDHKRQTILSVINDEDDEILLERYHKILSDKREHLEIIKIPLAHLGIYVQGWKLEYDEKILNPTNSTPFFENSYEACFYKEYLDNIVNCMWDLSTQIFGASSFSYEQLAAKVCENDIERIKMAVYRLSILSMSKNGDNTPGNQRLYGISNGIGIWAGDEEWKWKMYKDKVKLCMFITPYQLKSMIKKET